MFIYSQGSKLAIAAYKSNWPEYDNEYKKALLLVIQRSQKAFLFRAGLLPMNLDTFIMVGKLFSLTTVIYKLIVLITNLLILFRCCVFHIVFLLFLRKST